MRITLPSGTPAISVERASASSGLVIATDIWGLRPLYDDMAQRLSEEWNVTVCVPEPFPSESLPMELDPRVAAITRTDDRDRLRDIDEAALHTGCSRVVMIGFCMGGMYALKASSLETFDRIVAFYGIIRLPDTWHGRGQREPLDLVASGHPDRVMAVIGEVDPYTPPADVAALESLGVSTVRFPEASHAFVHDPSRDSHRAHDAAVAWESARGWLNVGR